MAEKRATIILELQDKLSAAAEKAFNVFEKGAAKLGQVEKNLTTFGKKLDVMGRNMQRTGRVLSVQLTAPLVAFGKIAVDEAVKADTAWRRVQKVFSGTAEVMRTELMPAAKELALAWGMSQIEIAGVMEELAAMGFKTIDIIDGTTKAVEVSKLGNLDLANSMELVVAMMQNYGARGQELTQLIADLNAVEDAGAARLDDMAVSVGRVASIARTAGLDIKQLGALMSVLIARGEQSTIAARALRTTFTRILSPTKAISELFESLGVNIEKTESQMTTITKTVGQNEDEMKRLERRIKTTSASLRDYEAKSRGANLTDEDRSEKLDELRGTLAVLNDQYNAASGAQETYTGMVEVSTGKLKSMDKILLELAGKWKDLDDTQKINFATIIAGRHHVDRFVKIMDDLGSEQSEYARIVAETSDDQENMNRMMNQLGIESGSAAVQFGRLNEKFRLFKEFVGRDIIPIIIPMLEKLGELGDKFMALDEQTRKNIVKFGMLLATLGPLLIFFGMVFQGIGTILVAGGKLLLLLKFLAQAFLLLAAHPLIALTIGIAALTVIIGTLIIKSDILKTKTDLVTEANQRSAEAADRFRQAQDDLRTAHDGIIDAELRLEGAQLRRERAQQTLDDLTKQYGVDALITKEAAHQLELAERDLETAQKDLNKKVEDGDQAIKDLDEAQKNFHDTSSETVKVLESEETAWGKITTAIGNAIGKLDEWFKKKLGAPLISPTTPIWNRQHGGLVPGPVGAPVPILAHGGERIVPRGSNVEPPWGGGGGGGGITINMTGPIVMDSEERTRQLADRIIKIMGRKNELAAYGVGF